MQNLGIHAKIWLSVSVFGLGYVTLLVLSQWTGYRTEAHLDVASSSLFPAALKSREAEEAFQRLTKRYNDAVLLQDAAGLKEADTDARAVSAALEAIRVAKGLSQERKQAIETAASAFPQYAAKSKSAYTSMIASKDNLSESMQSEMTSLAQQTKQFETGLREIREGISKDFQDELAAVTSSSSSQRRLALLLFVAVLAVSVIVVNFTIRRAIAEPIFGAVRGVRQAVQRVGSATGSVSNASEALARGATEQAASLEDASSSLEEVSSMTQQNAANARKADEVMKEAAGMVDGSVRSMSELTNAMNEMFEASREITKVMQTIDDIAFQTNLLALNAAVEAARAGEFGASFSVVAQEVRGLAQRARESAVGTSTLIEQIMSKVTRGRTLLSEANDAFRNVDKAVSDSGKLVSEIATASALQAKNLDDVTQAIHRVEVVTRQNAADAKETSQASTTMHDEAKLVSEIVQELVAVVGSGKE